ncbi:MAG TPA: tetratricopeptide repeat protein [Ktedonobacterales bacterium]|nr:tetratricopeptide repeat protein [Ktedonobacterales bacterium]
MPTLPTGTVTFLFSDVEGSTRLLQQLGARYATALEQHQHLLRAAFVDHQGQEVDTQGDSFFVAFPRAGDALAAAAQAQRALAAHAWPEGTTLRVRMGLHTGAPLVAADRYVGLDVHRAARIAAAAHGGQVLISQATRDLAEGELPPDALLRDLGEYRLKDLYRPEHLYQFLLPDLPADFPPLKTLDRARHNLPVQLTPLVGREETVLAVVALLARPEVHLLTLTGPGGIGKTRLALQVAAESVDAFADGVYLVALGTIADPALVPGTIAQTLGLREAGSASPGEHLRTYLADKRLLLVLDNCEQVIGAGPGLVELLGGCPGVKVLATSRISLHLRGEHEYPVPALALPALPAKRTTPALDMRALTQCAAVTLFIERAQAIKPDFAMTRANAPALAAICTRLDGLPLAIELAAARVKLVPPQALLARLSSRLKLLTGGPLDLPARQQTLRNTIAWSNDLLKPAEQVLFRRLGVFAGGCTLEAAETVCAAPTGATSLALDLFDGLGSLVDESLLRQEEEAGVDETGEPRFRMLETIREFSLEQLEAGEEAEALRRAHAIYYLALAEQAAPEMRGPHEGEWFERLEREHDNFRAALSWAREQRQADLGLRLSGALAHFWFSRGYLSEGREWLESLLAQAETRDAGPVTDTVPDDVRARALYGAGNLAVWQGDFQHAIARLQQCLALAQGIGELAVASSALNRLGIAEGHIRNEFEQAAVYWEQSLALARELGDPRHIAPPLNNLGEAEFYRGNLEQAAHYYEESLALTRQAGDWAGESVMLGNLGNVARRQGDLARAETLLREALGMYWQHGDPRSSAEGLEGLAALAGAAGQGARAARLLGAAAAIRETIGAPPMPSEQVTTQAAIASAQKALGEDEWARAFAAGQGLSLDQAVEEALHPSD